jgi:hypothetical protein
VVVLLLVAWCPHHHVTNYRPTDEAVAHSSLRESSKVVSGTLSRLLVCWLAAGDHASCSTQHLLLPPAPLLRLLVPAGVCCTLHEEALPRAVRLQLLMVAMVMLSVAVVVL